MKIIQITAVRRVGGESQVGQMDIEPMVLGLSDEGRVYTWEFTRSKWEFMGVDESSDPYRGQGN